MSSPILVVVHQATSDPGCVGAQLQQLGYNLDVRVPNEGDKLPLTLDEHDATVIFGGPMSANDDDTLPGIRHELDWIPIALDSGKPFLGICLGAQLLAKVLGGRVCPHSEGLTELGYYPIEATEEGRSHFADLSYVYHWHREGIELPDTATRLATGRTFANQAYRYENAYGLQFHPEMNRKILARWLTQGRDQLSQPGAQPSHVHRRGHRQYGEAVQAWLREFLPLWLAGSA